MCISRLSLNYWVVGIHVFCIHWDVFVYFGQMCLAYATHELRLPEHQFRVCPDNLWSMNKDQSQMIEVRYSKHYNGKRMREG